MKQFHKLSMIAFSLLIGVTAMAQGRSGAHTNVATLPNAAVKVKTTATSGAVRREQARVKGSVNANTNANQNGKDHANQNSVLNGGTNVKVRHHKKSKKNNL